MVLVNLHLHDQFEFNRLILENDSRPLTDQYIYVDIYHPLYKKI